MSSAEARQIAAGNPLSFLRVSRPEIDLPPATDAYAAEVYEHGRQNFRRLIDDRTLSQDPHPWFYLYRQVMGPHSQVGLVAAASCAEYLNGTIKKHELTRPDKEDDRARHIEVLGAQTGPVFLVYPAVPAIDEFVAGKVREKPAIDFWSKDGVRHSAWTISDPEAIRTIAALFARVPSLYIADGHHRSAAAVRVYQERQGAGQSDGILSVIFPHNQVQILPYNRVLKDLNGLTPGQLLKKLEGVFSIEVGDTAEPGRKHELCLYLEGKWRTLTFRAGFTGPGDTVEQLDVTLLQRHVMAPVFSITDPRRSERVGFVGGIRGTRELEKLVDSGQFACAFSCFPVGIKDLMTIADNGGIMPPKSTWFEPKLRDGMFCLML